MQNLEIYIFHCIEDVVISCFQNDQCLGRVLIKKRRLGEEMVEKFEKLLGDIGFSICSVDKIYLSNSFSTWNASRLVTLFSKTIACFGNASLFLKQESFDKKDTNQELRRFPRDKKSFRFIEDPEEVKPLYKKCPNTNI